MFHKDFLCVSISISRYFIMISIYYLLVQVLYVLFLSIVKIIGARLISQNVQILTWNFEAEGEMTFFTLGCLRLLFKAILLLYVYRYVTVLV